MNGDGTFNAHILVDKLAKLNSSQQSIETLSHWCILHRRNAKQVVETWERQFYSSPKDQRLYFLYLANDILQNSRRKSMEFVGEFWKVLPYALHDVIDNGDELGRKAAVRLVDIWEDRKVFSPQGQTLKEDLLGKRNGNGLSYKPEQPSRNMLEKLTASYHYVYNVCDEDKIFGKCWTAISSIENVEKEFGSNVNLGNISESGVANELWVQHGLLRECIEQLKNAESSRSTLVTHLREALNEQELKVNQLQDQLQVAQARYDQLGRLLLGQAPPPPPLENNLGEIPPPLPVSTYCETPPPPEFPPEHENGVHTTNEESRLEISGHNISYVFSSLASEGVIVQSDASKRQRLNNNSSTSFSSVPCFLPQPQHPPPPPPPPILYSDSMYQPPSLPFRPPPLPPTTFSYGLPSFPVVGVPPFPSLYQYGPDGGYFGQPSYPPPFR